MNVVSETRLTLSYASCYAVRTYPLGMLLSSSFKRLIFTDVVEFVNMQAQIPWSKYATPKYTAPFYFIEIQLAMIFTR